MSRESTIIEFVNGKQKPVTLSELTVGVNKYSNEEYSEAQIYASANQACTKQKIARGPEANTYCRLDYAGARLSKSAGTVPLNVPTKSVPWSEEPKAFPVEDMQLVKLDKPKRQRKVQVIGRFDIDQVTDDLLAMGLEQVPKSKMENFIGVPILPAEKRDSEYCHDAEYIMERGTKTYKSKPTRFTVFNVGPTPYVGVYP